MLFKNIYERVNIFKVMGKKNDDIKSRFTLNIILLSSRKPRPMNFKRMSKSVSVFKYLGSMTFIYAICMIVCTAQWASDKTYFNK